MEAAGQRLAEGWFQLMRLIKRVGLIIIEFLAQIENFQKMLWEKKKFITETFYIITLGNVPEVFYPDIADNAAQWEEWDRLLAIESRPQDLFSGNWRTPEGRVAFLKAHPSLPLDTRHFPPDFTDRLLASFDDLDEMTDGLLVHSENWQALNLLKEKYRERVKCVYIDPPYNTGGSLETFTYNNAFNHSSWLTFMKNRLEVAKEFLTEDGFIVIAIDHNELFYLGALADEIFGGKNRIGVVSVLSNPMGRQYAKFFSATNDYMLVYAKNETRAKFNDVVISWERAKTFNLEDEKGKYKLSPFLHDHKKGLRKLKPDNWYPIYISEDLKDISLEEKEGYFKLLPISDKGIERSWMTVRETTQERINDNELVAEKDDKGKIRLYYKFREQQRLSTCWIDKKYNANHYGARLLEKIIGRRGVSYPKSLYLIIDTLKIMTSNEDIILDFHAGSGTTGHATLALNKEDGGNRKFILVEQLDEHIEICNERNQKVLAQENIDDSFIYFELAKWNETAKEKILDCESLEELEAFFDEMYERYFLNYNLKIKEFKEKVLKEENFRNLSLDEQKKIFVAMLDNNQMYVNKTEMADKKFGISEKDQNLTNQFYNS